MLEEDDNRSIHSVESRRTQSTAGFSLATRLPAASYHGGADYYRDTNQSRQSSRSNMAAFPPSPSYAAGYGTQQGSVRGGSEFGYPNQARNSFQPPTNQSRNSFAPSNYGQQPMMPAMVSRQSMMSLGAPQMGMPNRDSTMSGFSNFGGTFPPNNFAMIQQQRPMSTFSSANPFMSNSPTSATISDSTSPTDDELVATLRYVPPLHRSITDDPLRSYLAHQDLVRRHVSSSRGNADPPRWRSRNVPRETACRRCTPRRTSHQGRTLSTPRLTACSRAACNSHDRPFPYRRCAAF